jgi:hypothetical protein
MNHRQRYPFADMYPISDPCLFRVLRKSSKTTVQKRGAPGTIFTAFIGDFVAAVPQIDGSEMRCGH